jgi:arsenite-transporting ATPase
VLLMATRPLLRDLQVLFFGGKGGVGKTTLASAAAVLRARAGHRTLLVSTDAAHSTGDMLGTELGDEPRAVLPKLEAVEIDPAVEADRYIAEVKGRIAEVTPPRLVAEVERQIDIARVTPGAEDAALFLRFARYVEEAGRRWERIVFDTAPLGHTLRLLALPEQMTAWMSGLALRRRKVRALSRMWRTVAGAAAGDDGGPDPVLDALEARIASFRRMREVLTDPTRAAFVFVATPERLPLLETERGVTALGRHGIPIGGVVVNRVRGGGEDGRRDREYAARFRRLFDGYLVHVVPELPGEVHGMDGVEAVVRAVPWLETDSPRTERALD